MWCDGRFYSRVVQTDDAVCKSSTVLCVRHSAMQCNAMQWLMIDGGWWMVLTQQAGPGQQALLTICGAPTPKTTQLGQKIQGNKNKKTKSKSKAKEKKSFVEALKCLIRKETRSDMMRHMLGAGVWSMTQNAFANIFFVFYILFLFIFCVYFLFLSGYDRCFWRSATSDRDGVPDDRGVRHGRRDWTARLPPGQQQRFSPGEVRVKK